MTPTSPIRAATRVTPPDETPAPVQPDPGRPAAPVRGVEGRVIDRDLSLLAFHRRVLDEAKDTATPLLERVKFLAIVGTNIDEFVMSRGAALRPRTVDDAAATQADWLHWRRLVSAAHRVSRDAYAHLHRRLVGALAGAGVHLLDYDALTPLERAHADLQFGERVLPRVTVLRWDPREAFPHVPNLGLNFAVVVRHPGGDRQLAVVRVPDGQGPYLSARPPAPAHALARGGGADVAVADPGASRGVVPERLLWLDQLLRAHLPLLFPRGEVLSAHAFRVVRDARDLSEMSGNLDRPDRAIEAARRRETSPIVTLAVDRRMPAAVVNALARGLGVSDAQVFRMAVVVDLRRLWTVCRLDRPDLHHPPHVPAVPAEFEGGAGVFDVIRRGDVLLHQPFESFRPVVDLFRQAARDPHVLAISATLYRTDRDESPIVSALVEAAASGKDVRVVVELKARFDEQRNAELSRALERAGARVVHGPATLKVHGKLALVTRREGARLRRYVHLSSGNYSTFTAGVYTDLSLLTCDDDIGDDAAAVFDFLMGQPAPRALRKLLVSPTALRDGMHALVEREIAAARRGDAGHIILKMNALLDPDMMALLERAAQSGVRVDLIVRGVCCLRPGVAGHTDGIHVRSIVGRFLEHSRVWYFRNGGREEVYLGSADLRPRNFDRRVEVMAPLGDRRLVRRVRDEILRVYLADNVKAHELGPDGRYVRLMPEPGDRAVSSQTELLERSRRLVLA